MRPGVFTIYIGNPLVYKLSGNSFSKVQELPTNGAADVQSFDINGDKFLSFASSMPGENFESDSLIYKWVFLFFFCSQGN